jgi:NTE family protein
MKQQPDPLETIGRSKSPDVAAETGNASQVEHALVFSGGGPVGYAWMAGLVAGLLDHHIDLSRAQRIVGTSAGSMVGAQLALGMDVAAFLANLMTTLMAGSNRQSALNTYVSALTGLGNVRAEFVNAACAANPDEARAAIGHKALEATTIGEDAFLTMPVYSVLAGKEWPPSFCTTSVSTTTGQLAVWSRDSHVDLAKAVAASSSIPGASPPVTLNGDRYMDGGVLSGLNADLAAGARLVLVVSCFSLTPPADADANLQRWYEGFSQELDAITAAGGSLDIIEPGQEFLRLSGDGNHLMNMNLIPEAVQVGRQQAMSEAARLRSWSEQAELA